MRVTYTEHTCGGMYDLACVACMAGTDQPLLEQPALFPGIYPASVGEQGTLFDLGESERKPAATRGPGDLGQCP